MILLFFIDLQSFYLPDILNYALIGFGLFFSYFGLTGIDFMPSILGGIFGFLSFFLVNFIYRFWRKRDGFGGGDIKLLAGLGSWFGVTSLMPIIIISSVLAIFFSGIMLVLGNKYKMTSMLPFGPFLVLSALIVYANIFLYPLPMMSLFYVL
jgi:leader peptidase (prepilin peptidase)/N-methyltransferase